MKTLALTLLILATSQSHANLTGQDGNGGFAFSNSPGAQLLRAVTNDLDKRIANFERGCLSNAALLNKPINWDEFRGILKNYRKNYLTSATRRNKDGEVEPLLFDFGRDDHGPYIEVQQIFFISYLSAQLTGETVQKVHLRIARQMIHETSHLFGYTESEATKFEEKVLNALYDPNGCKIF